jgi:CheY-like chemotaxis protein/RNase P subunit RPR2
MASTVAKGENMAVLCPRCGQRLRIPEDKLPSDRSVQITCPSCAERFRYEQHLRAAAHLSPATDLSIPPAAAPVARSSGAPAASASALAALICLDDPLQREACQKLVASMGYVAHVVPTQTSALEALRQAPYRLVFLDAAFDGTSPETNIALVFLRERPLDQRRYMFVVLCGTALATADSLIAYSHGVNLVLNHADVYTCSTDLLQHMAEHERLYRVYRELRQQTGKEV